MNRRKRLKNKKKLKLQRQLKPKTRSLKKLGLKFIVQKVHQLS